MVHQKIDPLLLPLLKATEQEYQALLSSLISTEAAPIARRIIQKRLRIWLKEGVSQPLKHDVEDMYGQVILQLLERLRDLLANPEENIIENFHQYVAVVTSHSCNQHFRYKFPERWRFKNRLRYLLAHSAKFAVWETSMGEWLCGLSSWRNQEKPVYKQEFQELRDNPESIGKKFLPVGFHQRPLGDLVSALFRFVHAPIELDEAVNILGASLGIRDQSPKEFGSTVRQQLEAFSDSGTELISRIDREIYLRQLWQEILQLPWPQRSALLMNLRDEHGNGALGLFTLTGIATIREIAATLNVPAEEFSTLWNELPLDDLAVARLLNVTRQQVINLRKSARERLMRRMNAMNRKH